MSNDQDTTLRDELVHVMRGNRSHIDFQSAIEDFPVELAGAKPHGAPHSAWQLLEHLRIAQHDILEFCRNRAYKSPAWPEGYWPEAQAPRTEQAWSETVAEFKKNAREMEELIQDPRNDLFKPIEGGNGQTLLREAMVVGNHNSYHLGQIVYLKKLLVEEQHR